MEFPERASDGSTSWSPSALASHDRREAADMQTHAASGNSDVGRGIPAGANRRAL